MVQRGMSGYSRYHSVWLPLLAMMSLEFFWGFITASNSFLIPVLKKHFALTQFQAQFVDTAFFIPYFVGPVVYLSLTHLQRDILSISRYKRWLTIGLALSMSGAVICALAANVVASLGDASLTTYRVFLLGLFSMALGFSLLMIVANPLVNHLGDKAHGAARLNLVGSFNSLGTVLGPVLIAVSIYGITQGYGDSTARFSGLRSFYLLAALVALLLCVVVSSIRIQDNSSTGDPTEMFRVTKELVYGMVAMFIYIGSEVAVASNLGAFLLSTEIHVTNKLSIDTCLSLYWGSLMIGRLSNSVGSFNVSALKRNILSCVLPFAGFVIILLVSRLRGSAIEALYVYTCWILFFILLRLAGRGKTARTLLLFSLSAVGFLSVGIAAEGILSLFSIISVGLFCSSMWPAIFNLSTSKLGRHSMRGSSLIIMMISGAAIIPPIQGYFADTFLGIKYSYCVPLLGFVGIAVFALGARNRNGAQIVHKSG